MNTVKQTLQTLIDELPDDCTLEDAQRRIYVLQKINNGLADIEAGNVVSQAQLEQRMSVWLEP
jgi:predicted transcriptional regulator